MPGGICILEGLVPFSVSLFGKFNLICFSVVLILLNISLAVTWGTLNYLKQQLQPTLLKTWRGCWTTSLRGRSQELPSPHRLPVWEGGKLGLFRPGKMPSFQAAMCSQNTKKVFLSAVPHDGHSPRPWTSLLLENTTRGAIDNEKTAPDKRWGFALLSWSHFYVMQWKIWSFFVWLDFDNCSIFSTML